MINNKNDLTDKYTKFLNRYRLSVNKENKCLSHIYWLPKFHRNPTKAWFIIAAPKCSLKQFSRSVNCCNRLKATTVSHYIFEDQHFLCNFKQSVSHKGH